MPNKRVLFFPFSLLLLPLASSGGPITTTMCPAQIETMQSMKQIPPGWDVSSEKQPSRLTNAGFYDGHPDQQAELAPSKSKESKRQLVNTWNLRAPHNGNIWIKCSYADTTLSLVKQIDASVSTCSVSYDAGFSPPSLVNVGCN